MNQQELEDLGIILEIEARDDMEFNELIALEIEEYCISD